MKLKDYKVTGWDGTSIGDRIEVSSEMYIVLLYIERGVENYNTGAKKNLLAVNGQDEILWVAELPPLANGYGWYAFIKYEDSVLKAWYGDYYCEIDIKTGKVNKSIFIK